MEQVRMKSISKNRRISTPEDVEALRKGSYQAYDKIFLAWRKPVFNLLLNLTGNVSEAEDITQEIFLDLWNYREKLDVSKKINTYLYLLARRSAIDFFRRKQNAGKYIDDMEWNEASHETSDSLVIKKEIELLKEIALNRMPEFRQNIYRLTHDEGLSNTEIAEKLNITKESVYTQLSLARKQLRELITLFIFLLLFEN